MQEAFGMEIPETLEEACDPSRAALLVYDMQIGVLQQVPERDRVVQHVRRVLEAARDAGVRVFFFRHMSLPKNVAGAFQLRQAMA
jgi:biuret amidohydrolase